MLITGILLALLVPFPLRTDPYLLHVFVMVGISIILALGLNFQVGSTGIPNLGFAAFYGVGAYASALLAINLKLDFWITIFLGALISAFFRFLVGLPSLKTRTYHLALVSIAFGLVVYILLNNLDFTGGPNGVKDIPAPMRAGSLSLQKPGIFGLNYPMQLNFYFLVLFFIAITLIVANALYHSKIGLYWNAVREDEIAAKCSGINVSSVKILAFCVGAFFAGIAGALYAHYIGYISPENFNMNVSLLILGMVIMGGMDSIAGACVGAFILTIAPEKFRSLADFRMVATGLILILMLIFRPAGIIPQSIRRYTKILSRKNAQPEVKLTVNEALLSVKDLTMRFGGLVAVDHVSFELIPGQILAVIGPNGAGKTTVFNVVTGIYSATEGQILFKGQSINRLQPHQIARLGIKRTFQQSRLFDYLSVLDNILVGMAATSHNDFIRAVVRRDCYLPNSTGISAYALEMLGYFSAEMRENCLKRAGDLTPGDRRKLEICRALASDPKVLLLDEPAAGMDPNETSELMEDILKVRTLKQGIGIILIEHDMAVVSKTADQVLVLSYGKVIASGTFLEVSSDPKVQEAYLGSQSPLA